jgi:hypothetical protein
VRIGEGYEVGNYGIFTSNPLGNKQLQKLFRQLTLNEERFKILIKFFLLGDIPRICPVFILPGYSFP